MDLGKTQVWQNHGIQVVCTWVFIVKAFNCSAIFIIKCGKKRENYQIIVLTKIATLYDSNSGNGSFPITIVFFHSALVPVALLIMEDARSGLFPHWFPPA